MQTEWLEKDYYEVLGVPETASEKDVTRAYRKLARELHPDTHPGDTAAEERFKEVSAAYDVIGDPAKRKEYDELRRRGPVAAGFGPAGSGPAGSGPAGPDGGGYARTGFTFRVEDLGDLGDLGGFGDLGDILGGFFGRGTGDAGGAGGARSGAPFAGRRAAGVDLGAELRLGFEDAVRGTTATVTVPMGADAPAGNWPEGESGKGPRRVKVRVPAGVEDGQTIRVAGRGGPGHDGGPPGDLYVTIRVAPHRLFGRKGRHLTLTVPVTYPEAVLGADIKVPSLDGEPVTVRIPPGTPSGRTFRVRGGGVKGARATGDLLVTVEVAVPKKVSAAERRALEALAEAGGASPRSHLGV
jgi:molecular chaperone DnaJ